MERLTQNNFDYCLEMCEPECAHKCPFYKDERESKCHIAAMYDKLREYEDTGLEPEEIKAFVSAAEFLTRAEAEAAMKGGGVMTDHAYKISLPNTQVVVYAKSRGEAIEKYIEQSGISREFISKHGTCKICTYSSIDYISPSDFEYWMKVIVERRKDDPELLHCEADELMEKVLRQLGYGKGLDLLEGLEVWYA